MHFLVEEAATVGVCGYIKIFIDIVDIFTQVYNNIRGIIDQSVA